MTAARQIVLASLTGLVLIGSSVLVWAEEEKRSEDKSREIASDDSSGPVYNPPMRGAPGGRVGGGTRGSGRDVFVLSVLAPDHTGRTTKTQPSLFWFISTPTALPVDVTIVDVTPDDTTSPQTAPLLETRVAAPVGRGVHRLRLADHHVELAAGKAYQWSVAVIADPARRSHDILASGTIELWTPDKDVAAKLATAHGEALVSRYAQAGIWYDALETVCDLIERSPADATSRRYRAALLKQAGLPEVAE